MRSLFSTALSLCSVDITIDSATWTAFPILQQQQKTTIEGNIAQVDSTAQYCTSSHETTVKIIACYFFVSSFVFHARVHHLYLFIIFFYSGHSSRHRPTSTCSVQQPANHWKRISSRFLNDLPFWESQIRCLFTLFDASMSRDYRVRFVSMQWFAQLAPSISSAKCMAVLSAFMFTFHFFVCQENSVASGKW